MKFNCTYNKLIPIHKLVPNPRNTNIHPPRQIELLAKIIDYQGQRSPIVVSNRSGFIVKGHARLEAMKKLGWEKVAIDLQDYESEAQEYADLEADNRIAELSERDLTKTLSNLSDLKMEKFDFEFLGLDKFEFMDLNAKDSVLEGDNSLDNAVTDKEYKEKELDENLETNNSCPSCGYVW